MYKLAKSDNSISKEQAVSFARRIYSDIATYIESHKEEYKKYLEELENQEDETN